MKKEINLKEFYQGLDIMFSKHDNIETERYLLSFLNSARQIGDIAAITAINNELGGFYRVSGKLDEAKAVYHSVLENFEAAGQQDTASYAVALMNTGNVYIAAKEYEQALKRYKKAVDIMNQCGMRSDYRMAALCNNISAVYRELADLEQAEEMALKALQIITNLPQHRVELATTYVNLAEVQIKMKKLEEAEANLTKAMHIFGTETDGRDVHYPAANAALGELYYYRGDHRSAQNYYQKALDLIERDFGRNTYYKTVLNNLNRVKLNL